MWSQTVRNRKTKTTAINQGKASEMLAYLVREHNKTISLNNSNLWPKIGFLKWRRVPFINPCMRWRSCTRMTAELAADFSIELLWLVVAA